MTRPVPVDRADPWLTVIGVGADGLQGLPPAHRALIDGAGAIWGSDRLLADPLIPADKRVPWGRPFASGLERLLARRGQPTVLLATGDPMLWGVGAVLADRLPQRELCVLPAPSCLSLAAARLGWPLHETTQVSLHGRPTDRLRLALVPNARILALTAGAETYRQAAGILAETGFGQSRLTILEALGGPEERVIETDLDGLRDGSFADLSILAIEAVAGPDTRILPRVPGLPDNAFRHDGQLTKREVRAVTLAALAPLPGRLLWDVGAGSGSVAIEWLRAEPGARATAVERDPARLAMIADNVVALGTPDLHVVAGSAPGCLAGLERPDAVFLGGAVSDEPVFEACWSALLPGGRLVANAVTLEGERALADRQAKLGGDLARIAVSNLAPVGRYRALEPGMAVLQWRADKGQEP